MSEKVSPELNKNVVKNTYNFENQIKQAKSTKILACKKEFRTFYIQESKLID